MAFTGRASPTRGALVRLRSGLEFIQNGLSILKLKRDRLAEELNLLLRESSRREKAETELIEVYGDYQNALAILSYAKVRSTAHSVEKMKVDVKERSVMNVLIPALDIVRKPSTDVIQDPSLYKVAVKMRALIDEWLEIARIEASIERIAYELSLVNRKVNAIEKVVVPDYTRQIKYIEDFLSDEELEDFTRIKHIKTVSRES